MLRSVHGKIKQKISICEINRRRKKATEYAQNQYLGHLSKQSKHSGSIRLPNRNRRKTYRKRFDIFSQKIKKQSPPARFRNEKRLPKTETDLSVSRSRIGTLRVIVTRPQRKIPPFLVVSRITNEELPSTVVPVISNDGAGYIGEKILPAQKTTSAPLQRGTG